MKNILFRALVKLFRKKESSSGQKILVISTTALGDTLWATPSLESLRKSFPTAYIALLTSPIGFEALLHNPWTDDLFVLEGFFKTWKKLPRFSDIVILHTSQRFILPLASLLGASKIVGTKGINKGLDDLLTISLNNRDEHEIIRRLQLIEKLGAKRCTESLSFFLQADEKSALSPKTIILHPGSSDTFKRWPKDHFITVGQELQKNGYKIVITGTKKETELIEEIAKEIPHTKTFLALSLRKFASFLESVDLLITNDTGPVHLACALKTPVIALYCPTDPNLSGPHKAPNAYVIAKPPTCIPCLKRKCQRPFCMLQFGPDDVVTAAKNMLHSIP